MMGMVYKDCLLLRKQLSYYLIFFVLYTGLAAAGIFPPFVLPGLVVFIGLMLPMSSFAYDEQARWDKYAAALPGGRAGVVRARYVFTLLACLVSLLFSLSLQLLTALVSGAKGQEWMDLLLSGLLPVAYGCLMNAILLPLLFRFGSQKGRLYLLLALGLGVGLVFGSIGILKEIGLPLTELALPLAALPVVGLLALVPSYFLSLRVFRKKDL